MMDLDGVLPPIIEILKQLSLCKLPSLHYYPYIQLNLTIVVYFAYFTYNLFNPQKISLKNVSICTDSLNCLYHLKLF